MEEKSPLAITISHQFGSGGAYVGQRLAEELNIMYLDREIIIEAAKILGTRSEELEGRDERATPVSEAVLRSFAHVDLFQLAAFSFSDIDLITDSEIFNAESEVIYRIAKEKPTVILGKCGTYILKDHPKHVSVYLHADLDFRIKRVMEIYSISENEAKKLVDRRDRERYQYINRFCNHDMNDSRNYDLSLNTKLLGLDKTVSFIIKYLDERF